MEKDQNNIWYLAGPMFQYNEDVKALARQYGLKIVDANVAVERVNAADHVPEVTIKAEYSEHVSGGNGDHVPTVAELIASRDLVFARNDHLDDMELQLNQRAGTLDAREQLLTTRETAVGEREKANEAEAQRLRTEAAGLQAAKDAAAVATPASTDKPAKAGKAA